MTRAEILRIIVGRARTNGFEFRRWYVARLGLPWISAEAALILLDQQRRYYALLFSHEFACAFWKAGEEITFAVPKQQFQRVLADGSIKSVKRKPFMRRSSRRDAWKYHLRQMALADEPLRYIRKYLNVEGEFDVTADGEPSDIPQETTAPVVKKSLAERTAESALSRRRMRGKPIAHPIPDDLPAFLKRPPPLD